MRAPRLPLALLLASVCAGVGCAKNGGLHSGRADSATPDTSADSGADSPVQTAGETGHSTSPGLELWETAGPCGAWSGVQRVGTRWTYVPSDRYREAYGFDGSYTVTVTAIDGETVTLSQEGDYRGDDGSFTWTRTDTWRCDAAGAWWTASSAVTDSVSGINTTHSEGTKTFEPGWLLRPASAELASSWEDAFVYNGTVNGASSSADVTCVSSVQSEEVRIVPAGEVTARHVDQVCTGVNGHPFWMVQYAGLVETEDEVLSGYEP